MRTVQKHKRRLKRGEFFPPFLYISIINSCNLRCQGCWVDVAAKQQKIDVDGDGSPDQRSQGDGQLVLRHPRRRAVHAPRVAGDFRAPSATATSRSSPTGSSSPTRSPSDLRRAGQRHAADQRRRQRDRSATSAAARSDVYSKTMEGLQNCLKQQSVDRRLHQPLPDNFDSAHRSAGSTA